MLEQAEVNLAAVTRIQQQIWSKGDFAHVAPIVQVVADRLVEAVDVLRAPCPRRGLWERQHSDRRRTLLR